jgi:hypothetical protein
MRFAAPEWAISPYASEVDILQETLTKQQIDVSSQFCVALGLALLTGFAFKSQAEWTEEEEIMFNAVAEEWPEEAQKWLKQN